MSMWLAAQADTVGIIGVVIILISYYLLNVGKVNSNDLSYLWLNIIGSALVLASLYVHWNLPSVVIEVAWIIISLIGMYRAVRVGKKD